MVVCSTTLAPGIAAFNRMRAAGKLCKIASFNDDLAALCKKAAELTPDALLPVDAAILCLVLCCCKRNPNPGSTGQNLHQACVRQTLDAVDAMMDDESRYKAEVSYNMRADPPKPLMDKDDFGKLTTRPLRYSSLPRMMQRIKRDYPDTKSLGEKDIRRPDVVIVRDPSKPPSRDNLVRVVEMKFGKDRYGDGQLEDYRAIDPDGQVLELNERTCMCNRRDKKEEDLSLLIAAEAWEKAQLTTTQKVVVGGVTVVLVLGTVALFLFPFEGPGEAVTGSAAASTGAAALGDMALSPAGQRAIGHAAAASWVLIFGPGPSNSR